MSTDTSRRDRPRRSHSFNPGIALVVSGFAVALGGFALGPQEPPTDPEPVAAIQPVVPAPQASREDLQRILGRFPKTPARFLATGKTEQPRKATAQLRELSNVRRAP